MVSLNPFADFRIECKNTLMDTLDKLYPEISFPSITLEYPPSPAFGELSSSICFELSKHIARKPREVANQVAEVVDVKPFQLIRSVKAAGEGYINFYVDLARFSDLNIRSIRALDNEYGYVKSDEPIQTIVEHTSVNPIHPIHIGQARNPMLGDALARILKARGHPVFRHYYIDDVGRQTAVIAYGYEKLGEPTPEGKPDHFIGLIYTITSAIMEVRRLKKEIKLAKKSLSNEETAKLQKELDDWMSVAINLEDKYPKLFGHLLNKIGEDEDPESIVSGLNSRYEAGEEKAKRLIRKVCQRCIEGFRETLGRVGVSFDSWDWESDFAWNSDVSKVINRLKKTPYVFREGGVLEFNADRVTQDLNLKEAFGLREEYEIPSLTLIRADGTTLYTTRDIPYSLWKFRKAKRVINVVGMEQSLSQLQLKLALYALGQKDYARNLVHFAYNLVRLPGYRMSGRRGRYVTLDEVIDEAVKRAYNEVSKRSPHMSEEKKHRISHIVGIGAMKYALVEVDATKPVVFTWDRVLDFEKNSAPYIQYSHARACSILRKALREPKKPDCSLLVAPLERDLILMLARFPEVFIDAAENLKPNIIADFANALADKFNKFYTTLPVIKARPPELGDARLALVDSMRIVLRNASNLLGIEVPNRM